MEAVRNSAEALTKNRARHSIAYGANSFVTRLPSVFEGPHIGPKGSHTSRGGDLAATAATSKLSIQTGTTSASSTYSKRKASFNEDGRKRSDKLLALVFYNVIKVMYSLC